MSFFFFAFSPRDLGVASGGLRMYDDNGGDGCILWIVLLLFGNLTYSIHLFCWSDVGMSSTCFWRAQPEGSTHPGWRFREWLCGATRPPAPPPEHAPIESTQSSYSPIPHFSSMSLLILKAWNMLPIAMALDKKLYFTSEAFLYLCKAYDLILK